MTCESVACRSYFTNKSVRDVFALRDLWYLWAMCVRASMKAAKPLHIVLATNPNPTRARGYPLNINPKPDPKPDSISGPAGSGRVADLYHVVQFWTQFCHQKTYISGIIEACFFFGHSQIGHLECFSVICSLMSLYSESSIALWTKNKYSHWGKFFIQLLINYLI